MSFAGQGHRSKFRKLNRQLRQIVSFESGEDTTPAEMRRKYAAIFQATLDGMPTSQIATDPYADGLAVFEHMPAIRAGQKVFEDGTPINARSEI